MSEFKKYRRSAIAELRPYEPGEQLIGVSISAPDRTAGSPKAGDMIARNPKNHADQWLVARQYFADNFEAATAEQLLSVKEAESIRKGIEHAVNYHSLDAKLNMADNKVADLLIGEVVKHMLGTTDVQVIERMTPEQRANIGKVQ